MKNNELHIHGYPQAIIGTPFFPPELSLVFDSPTPDLIALHTSNRPPGSICLQIADARRRFGWRPLLYAHYGEGVDAAELDANRRNIDFLFSYAPTDGHNYQHERYHCDPRYAQFAPAREAAAAQCRAPRRFCAFIYRNGNGQHTHVRNAFAQKLMQVRRVDCPGRVLNNCDPLPLYGAPENAGVYAKLRFLAECRFTISFENFSASHYITEKIFHPLLVGSIPIYWGCPQIAEYYNPAAFINCHDFPSFDAVIERVLAIDADPALQQAYRSAPMLLPNSRIHAIHRDLYSRHAAIAEQAIARRQLPPTRPARDRLRNAAFVARHLPMIASAAGRVSYMRSRSVAGWLLRRANLRQDDWARPE